MENLGGGEAMTDTQSIVMAASQLPEGERVRVIEALLDTLEPETADEPDAVAEAWREEVMRRSKELHDGTVRPVSWSEIRAEGERMLDAGSSG
jgi:putative addiction module component (TIGR02574 family)